MPTAPRRRLFAGLLLVPLLTGCFSDNGGDGASSDDASDRGRLRVALAFPPAENFSPYGADATLLSRLGVTEGLTRLDGNGAAAPALASSWTRQGDRDWLFTLRGAEFHDGTPVTPAAVVTALDRAGRAEPVTAALSGVRLTARAVGDDQVRITTADPDPALPHRLSSPGLAILAAKAYGKDGRADPRKTATGPFVLAKANGAARATLERFPEYWGGLAQSPGIDAQFISDGTARTNALRTGEVDVAEALPVAQAASLDRDTILELASARTTSLQLNTDTGPFADPRVRAAARQAIDTAVLVEDVYEGYADPGQGIFGPAVNWAAGKRVKPTGRAEPADLEGGEGVSITLATYDNRPELPEVAQVLQQQLEQVGFTVKLEVRESSRIEGDALDGRFDAFLGARNTLLDTGDAVSVLASDYTCDGSYNTAQLCDRSVDRAVDAAQASADPAGRQDATMAAEAAILGADASVPLVHQRIIQGVGPKVGGVVLDPYERTLVGLGTRR